MLIVFHQDLQFERHFHSFYFCSQRLSICFVSFILIVLFLSFSLVCFLHSHWSIHFFVHTFFALSIVDDSGLPCILREFGSDVVYGLKICLSDTFHSKRQSLIIPAEQTTWIQCWTPWQQEHKDQPSLLCRRLEDLCTG